MYSYSPAMAVMNELPEYEWEPWRFIETPKSFWTSIASKARLSDSSSLQILQAYLYKAVLPQLIKLSPNELSTLGPVEVVKQLTTNPKTEQATLDSKTRFLLRIIVSAATSAIYPGVTSSDTRLVLSLIKLCHPGVELSQMSTFLAKIALFPHINKATELLEPFTEGKSKRFWSQVVNQRKYLDFVKQQLPGQSFDSFYLYFTRATAIQTGGSIAG